MYYIEFDSFIVVNLVESFTANSNTILYAGDQGPDLVQFIGKLEMLANLLSFRVLRLFLL